MPFLKMRLSKFVSVSSHLIRLRRVAVSAIDVTRVTPQCFDLCRGRRRDDPPARIGRSIGMSQADHPPDLARARRHERMVRPSADRDLRVGEEVLDLDTKPTGQPISRAARPDDERPVGRSR